MGNEGDRSGLHMQQGREAENWVEYYFGREALS
jgi:hypothetical protein